MSEKHLVSVLTRARSFSHAGRGVWLFFTSTPNAWIQLCIFVGVVALGVYVEISHIEWVLLLLTAGLVFVAEAINTAIEIDINLTSPEYHPHARDTKDVAAGAVLLASVTAAVVGVTIFLPYLI